MISRLQLLLMSSLKHKMKHDLIKSKNKAIQPGDTIKNVSIDIIIAKSASPAKQTREKY